MNRPRECHTKSEKDKYPIYSLYGESKKTDTNEPIYKTEMEAQMQKTDLRL